MIKIFTLIITLSFFLASLANANVIGTEYQIFNPDLSGTDFTTVHSSEPVKPCMCNLGVFFNYAKNTLTYSDKYYATNTDLKGVRANDYLIGADVYAAFGINKNWDIGVALPFVVTAKNDDPYGVSYFDKFGLTEIRPMTKYRFSGDDSGGWAIIFSGNFNTIKDNPFAGENSGPTVNLELARDITTEGGLKLAGNLGFRKRSPGKQLTSSVTGLPVPFVPFNDAFLFSGALADKFESINSDVVAELKGSISGRSNDDSVKSSQQSLEIDLGIRHDWAKNLNLQAGVGTKLADAQATPDIRAYIGLNYQVGPVCEKPVVAPKVEVAVAAVEIPAAVVKNYPVGVSKLIDLNMPVTSENPANYKAYRWKIGASPEMNCSDKAGYSDEISGEIPIVTHIGEIPDGGITLCAVAKNLTGLWQPFSSPTIIIWEKKKGYELFRINASILFDFDKDNLQKRSYGELEKINKYLKRKAFTKCIIEGHTDSVGTDEYNLDLSRRRAITIKKYLIKKYKFDESMFVTKGMGEANPTDSNATVEGRAQNRHVEFKVFRK